MRATRPNPSLHAARLWFVAGIIGLLGIAASTRPADAGCGCAKPPPAPAQVRPPVTYQGMPVTLFSPSLVAGQSYTVRFTAMNGQSATVSGVAAVQRDLADAVVKPQLVVTLPALPLGPTAITVTAAGATVPVLSLADRTLTVAATPIALPAQYGAWTYPGERAAVDRDGVVYLSLDLTGMTTPLIFEAQLAGYPLRFSARDLVFTNTQGFLMQLLVQPATGEAIPGMFVYPAATPTRTTHSDTLHYSRHEFNTYFLQHLERLPHAVDPTDANWHLDGSPHIDHDHLIVAIMGRLDNGALPVAGATPPFDLKLKAFSLFHQGLVGTGFVGTSQNVRVDSFTPAPSRLTASAVLEASLGTTTTTTDTTTDTTDAMMAAPTDGTTTIAAPVFQWDSYGATAPSYSAGPYTYGTAGDIFTNGNLNLGSGAIVYGNATAASFTFGTGATITGTRGILTNPTSAMQVQIPPGLPDLGAVLLSGSKTIVGPGSFKLASLSLGKRATLYIDNSKGPVTLYVSGAVTSSVGSIIRTADPNPEKFAIYVASTSKVSLGNGSSFYGVIYAPASPLVLSGSGEFFGAFLGGGVSLGASSRVHYDQTLRGH